MTNEELEKAIEMASVELAAMERHPRFALPRADGIMILQALLHLNEAVKEAEGILERINPAMKMSDTVGTLERRIFNYSEAAKYWLEKWGKK